VLWVLARLLRRAKAMSQTWLLLLTQRQLPPLTPWLSWATAVSVLVEAVIVPAKAVLVPVIAVIVPAMPVVIAVVVPAMAVLVAVLV